MTDPTPPDVLNIEDNKVVRRNRAQGCTCTWIWVDEGGTGGTNPAIDLPYNPSCPVNHEL